MYPCKHPRATGRRLLPGLVSVFLISLVLVAGCGGKDAGEKSGESVVLATVGDTDITAAMYEKGLAKMEVKDLPTMPDGRPADTATLEGKQEFLKVLINKELLRQKALQLGYDQDATVAGARASLSAYHAGMQLWDDVVGSPASTISEEELQHFYDNLGKVRHCQFLITNFKERADEARKFAQTGADWDDVVARFHDGSPSPSGKYDLKVPYGQYSPSFENPVFAAPIGGVAEPMRTNAGYWVVRVLEETQGDKPDLETAKAKILDVTHARKVGAAREQFKAELHAKYKLFIDETALRICYEAIPEGGIMDPETNQPRAKESLEPLNVPVQELGRIFYSYQKEGKITEQTLADYKGHFDNMSVFQRPKKSDMLGGLRQHLIDELERGMVDEEAKARGLYEHPKVLANVNDKVEEVMVTRLYGDTVKFEERVTPEDVDVFYAEHLADYQVPELRSGRLVICLNQESAAQAKAAAEGGRNWRGILKEFDIDRENTSRGGQLKGVSANGEGPFKDAMFGIGVGEVSEPFLIDNGRYGVVTLESIEEPRTIAKEEVREQLGTRIRNIRKEEAFQVLLAKWKDEFGLIEHPENLAGLPSREELVAVQKPDNLVPRNN